MHFLKIAALRLRRKMILFFALVFIAGICSLVIYKIAEEQFSEEEVQLNIGLLNLDKSKECEATLDFVFNIPEIRNGYNFIEVESEQEGLNLVNNDEIYSFVILPENFMYSLFTGENASPTIIKSPSPSFQTKLSSELMQILVWAMQDTQSGIYTATDFTRKYNVKIDEEFIWDSNYVFIKEVMFRKMWFNITDLEFEKVLPIDIHYALALGLFFMLISSAIFYYELNIGRDFLVLKQLKSTSKAHIYLRLSQILLVFMLYFIILIAISIGLGGEITVASFLSILNAAVLFMATQLLIFSIFSQYITAVFINIMIQVCSLFLAGGILPTLFLPDIVQKFSYISPIRNIIDLLASSFVIVDNLWMRNILVLIINMILIVIVVIKDSRQLDRRMNYETVI